MLSNSTSITALPFLKWAGGKRWLAPQLSKHFSLIFDRYHEPFLGGGAIFFNLRPKKAFLSDLNSELIELYCEIRERPAEITEKLIVHQNLHSKRYYYEVRSEVPACSTERAARMLYLNRTCFNGIYRVNLNGKFNVPIGTKTRVIVDGESFFDFSDVLKNADIQTLDFEEAIARARTGDFVYIDPPYTVAHNNNGFVKYNNTIFSWEDQVRLRRSIEDAAFRGVKILLSNADHASIRDLYHGFGNVTELERLS